MFPEYFLIFFFIFYIIILGSIEIDTMRILETGVLQPLDGHALLKADMTRGLKVLHANADVLRGVMDVFLKEPLLDWRQEVMPSRRKKLGRPQPGPDSFLNVPGMFPECSLNVP
jgi:hypothetical protein